MRKRTRIIQDKRRRTRCAQLAADAFDEKLFREDGRENMEGEECAAAIVYEGAGYIRRI